MNKLRRKTLLRASELIETALSLVQDVKDEEYDCMINFPENLQNSERYELMESAVDNLEDVLSSLNEAKRSISEATA